jgi:alcohol dehydrogenase class IV
MRDVGISPSLRELGVQAGAISQMAKDALKNMGIFIDLNPRRAELDQVVQMYRDAM